MGAKTATCRDDRDINQHFLRQAAKDLGFYWEGFGWHSLRREAVTFGLDPGSERNHAIGGHSTAEMSLLYTLADQQAHDAAIRHRQEIIIGKLEDKVN